MYSSYESQFNVTYPEGNNATYFSLMNYSDDLNKPFQRWYRYKEGFSVDLVKELIRTYNKNPNGIILDPFMGSGSTLLGASDMSLNSIGFEVNPFSYFLTSCKLRKYNEETINEFKIAFEDILNRSFDSTQVYPLPGLSISSKVFDSNIENYYMGLKYLIMNYSANNSSVKKLLKLGWLSCLENISNYRKAGNGLKKRKYVKPRILTIQDVYVSLQKQYINMYDDMISSKIKTNITIYNESCKNMKNRIDKDYISGIIFSPPYANCFDYTEIYKLELWFGDFVKEYADLKFLRRSSLHSHLNGDLSVNEDNIKSNNLINSLISEVEKKDLWDKRIPNMLRLYFNDMFCVLEDCYRVLENKGFCSIIIGNSAYGGVIIPTDLILAQYASNLGFKVDKIEVDRYIITSSQQYEAIKENKKYLRESLICLKKEN